MVAHFSDRTIYCRGCGKTRMVCGGMNVSYECSDCQRKQLGAAEAKSAKGGGVQRTGDSTDWGLLVLGLVVGVFVGWWLWS